MEGSDQWRGSVGGRKHLTTWNLNAGRTDGKKIRSSCHPTVEQAAARPQRRPRQETLLQGLSTKPAGLSLKRHSVTGGGTPHTDPATRTRLFFGLCIVVTWGEYLPMTMLLQAFYYSVCCIYSSTPIAPFLPAWRRHMDWSACAVEGLGSPSHGPRITRNPRLPSLI